MLEVSCYMDWQGRGLDSFEGIGIIWLESVNMEDVMNLFQVSREVQTIGMASNLFQNVERACPFVLKFFGWPPCTNVLHIQVYSIPLLPIWCFPPSLVSIVSMFLQHSEDPILQVLM